MNQSCDPVLVTGSAGRLGRAAVAELKAHGHDVRPYDLRPSPGCAGDLGGHSLLDPARLDAALRGCHAAIHLAATVEDLDLGTVLVPNNILGLEKFLDAVVRQGVKRVVLASSIQFNMRQSRRGPWPVRLADPPTPLRWYAATKVMLESIGYSYAEDHQLELIAVRFGWCPRDQRQVDEITAEEIAQDTYLSPGDAGRFLRRSILAPIPVGFHVVYATSRPLRKWVFDPAPARQLLGWEPLDEWPTGAVPSAA